MPFALRLWTRQVSRLVNYLITEQIMTQFAFHHEGAVILMGTLKFELVKFVFEFAKDAIFRVVEIQMVFTPA